MTYDAVVVGSGPNGLAAAIRLAQADLSVLVIESNDEIGGGTRTAELTEPGFLHDVCSAVMPFAEHSAAFRSMPLEEHGLAWLYSEVEVAHPLDGGDAALVFQDIERTSSGLGADAKRYKKQLSRWVQDADDILNFVMGPMIRVPNHPITMAKFGLPALQSVDRFTDQIVDRNTKALIAGVSGHSVRPFSSAASVSVGLALLMSAHAYRWPIPRGGAHSITKAMVSCFESLGGTVETGRHVTHATDLPPARLKLLSSTPIALSSIFDRPTPRWAFGPGVFKIDWALNGPIPWTNPAVGSAATVHVGGTYEEIAAAEQAVHRGLHPAKPYVLIAQPTNIDPSRAPEGKHVAWGYCHVPNGSDVDMVDDIESQIERFAPGFRDLILAKHVKPPSWYASYNDNYVGGDIGAGAFTLRQVFGRPKLSPNPYSTPLDGVFLCGASTAPGGGVHGMAGWNSAAAALKSIGMRTDN
ncbi:MAG: NAD(P)/FAD-dependent oxidoreductase [Acidimicrobiia bacterium]|nr:NAD(P)/FAD-dependent oxidoreductase [Acidimicrobiia bacterium]